MPKQTIVHPECAILTISSPHLNTQCIAFLPPQTHIDAALPTSPIASYPKISRPVQFKRPAYPRRAMASTYQAWQPPSTDRPRPSGEQIRKLKATQHGETNTFLPTYWAGKPQFVYCDSHKADDSQAAATNPRSPAVSTHPACLIPGGRTLQQPNDVTLAEVTLAAPKSASGSTKETAPACLVPGGSTLQTSADIPLAELNRKSEPSAKETTPAYGFRALSMSAWEHAVQIEDAGGQRDLQEYLESHPSKSERGERRVLRKTRSMICFSSRK